MASKPERKKRAAAAAAQPEDQAAHYTYLLETLPRTVIQNAHIQAFVELTPERRQDLFDRLRQLQPQPDADPADDPDVLVALVRRAQRGEPVLRADSTGEVAARFVASDAVRSYFTSGVGAVSIDDQPLWIAELVKHEFAPIDASTVGPRTKSDVNLGHFFG